MEGDNAEGRKIFVIWIHPHSENTPAQGKRGTAIDGTTCNATVDLPGSDQEFALVPCLLESLKSGPFGQLVGDGGRMEAQLPSCHLDICLQRMKQTYER